MFDSYWLDFIAGFWKAQKTQKKQTQAVIRRILLSKLQHANIFFAVCFPQTSSEKKKNKQEKWEKKKAVQFMLHKVL